MKGNNRRDGVKGLQVDELSEWRREGGEGREGNERMGGTYDCHLQSSE